MHEHEGAICKTGIYWIIGQNRRHGKKYAWAETAELNREEGLDLVLTMGLGPDRWKR